MALPIYRPNTEVMLTESTTSIATTPVAAAFIAPCKGMIERVMAAAAGTTSGTITVAVSVNNGSDIASSTLTVAAGSNARAGTVIELPLEGSSATFVNEGDCITFTPSGGTGSSIGGAFALVIRK